MFDPKAHLFMFFIIKLDRKYKVINQKQVDIKVLNKDLNERENEISYMKEKIKEKDVKKKILSYVSVKTEECSSSRKPSFHVDKHHNRSHTAKSVHADKSSLASKFVHIANTFGTYKKFQIVKSTSYLVNSPSQY
ncbi:unnamed protein product [Lactuca saligna]|uniref:Uncharacterized protein n=1 Tax=Lactuca saligna TaxID=75948 RepID=A0AA35UZM0_LACSI|nr:unnamed protein product [Lactuca saligna]